MEKLTAQTNAFAVFCYAHSFFPEETITYYRSPKFIEIVIHVDDNTLNPYAVVYMLKDIVIEGAEVNQHRHEDSKSTLISIGYMIE